MKRQEKKQLQLNKTTIDRLDNQQQLPIEEQMAIKGGNDETARPRCIELWE